jgi:hypothetical protein
MQSKHIGSLYVVYTQMTQNLYNIKFVVANNMISISEWRWSCCMSALSGNL